MKTIILVIILTLSTSFAKDTSAYDNFGGKKVIKKVVDDLMINLLSNEKTKSFFEFADQERIKNKLVEQFCRELGGPCKYTGKSMKESHKDQEIKRSHFFALVEELQKAMNQNKVPQRAQNKLLAKLAPMHKDVVTE